MPSSIESIASFSVVMGETFAAVGLSTLVPNTFIALTKAAKGGGEAISDAMLTNAKIPGAVEAAAIMRGAAGSLDSMDILLPHDAKIHAEFEFQGADKVTGDVSLGAQVECVSVKAGYSAMYESKSSNKITLDVNFATVHVALGGTMAPGKPKNIMAVKSGDAKIIVWDAVPGATTYVVEGIANNAPFTAPAPHGFYVVPDTQHFPIKGFVVAAQNSSGSTKSAAMDVSEPV